jgi:4a-hydroxytetrahydrobiopterin dehydratase
MGALADTDISTRLAALDGWTREGALIVKLFRFADYHETMAFVNAVAWIAHRSDHHPDLEVGYNRCRVAYTTHDTGGLSEQDFACAARIDALFRP